jgi:hypothetical protein
MDSRHYARKRLFDRWYNNAKASDIEKLDVHHETDEISLIVSLFVSKLSPYNQDIKELFSELSDENFYS